MEIHVIQVFMIPLFSHMLQTQEKNMSRKLLIISLSAVTQTQMEIILRVSAIEDWKVKCRLPIMYLLPGGVIGPVGLDSDLVELKKFSKE